MKGGEERIQRTNESLWMQPVQSQVGKGQQSEYGGRKGQRDFGKGLRVVRGDDKGQEQRRGNKDNGDEADFASADPKLLKRLRHGFHQLL